jgi:hypothetical protein
MSENEDRRPLGRDGDREISSDADHFDSIAATPGQATPNVPREIEDFPDLRVIDNAYARALWDADMIALDGLAEAVDKIFWWAELLDVMTNPAAEPYECGTCVARWTAEAEAAEAAEAEAGEDEQ